MGRIMKECIRIMIEKERDYSSGLMVLFLRAILKGIISMAQEHTNGQMGRCMLVSLRII